MGPGGEEHVEVGGYLPVEVVPCFGGFGHGEGDEHVGFGDWFQRGWYRAR